MPGQAGMTKQPAGHDVVEYGRLEVILLTINDINNSYLLKNARIQDVNATDIK
jgi:hypothetical protein